MTLTTNAPKITQPFLPVKSKVSGDTLPSPDSLNTHSSSLPKVIIGNRDKVWRETSYYGCSKAWRILSPQYLLKRFDQVRDALDFVLGLTSGERECILIMLRLGAYYGKVYPKASAFAEYPGCSKSTFRRAVRKLKDLGLCTVIPRDLKPTRRQISNLYLLQGLLLLIARYLAEHGARFYESWLRPYLAMPGRLFWSRIYQTPEARAGPGVLALGDL